MTYFDEDMLPEPGKRERREPEHCLQVQVKAFCREAIDCDHEFFAFDRVRQHSRFQHAREAARGVRRATPDTELICAALNGRPIWCELKVPGKTLTDDQERMGARLRVAGALWFWADSVTGYMDGIAGFGVPLRRNARLIAEHREGLFQSYLLANKVPGIPSYKAARDSRSYSTPARVRRAEKLRRVIPYALALTLLSMPAVARPPDHPDPALAPWFKSLWTNDGRMSCCDISDCRAVPYRLTPSGYEVSLSRTVFPGIETEGWRAVPQNVVLARDNPTGEGIACVMRDEILCFIPAAQG